MKPIDRLRAKVIPRDTVVRSRQPLGERLVVLTADQPMPTLLSPGDVIAVRITSKGFGPTGTWRRYTVSSSTAAAFEIVAFRTETGPATPFLDALTVGASLVVRGLEAPVPPPRATTGLLAVVGDESAIGTVRALASASGPRVIAGLHMSCSAIVPTALLGSASCLVLADTDAVSAWIDSVVASNERVSMMAVGRYETNQAVRTQLLALGVARDHMTFRTYWKPGRAGME